MDDEAEVRGRPDLSSAVRVFCVLTWVSTAFVFAQFFTSSEFVRSDDPSTRVWIAIHGYLAYGVLVPALIAAVVAIRGLRRSQRQLTAVSVGLFGAAVGQWGTGHLISTFGANGWVPFHIFFSSVVLALAVWATVRAALLRRVPVTRTPGSH